MHTSPSGVILRRAASPHRVLPTSHDVPSSPPCAIHTHSRRVQGFPHSVYKELLGTAAGKPVALSEIGLAPDATVLASQNHSYALMWGGFETNANTPAGLRAFYHNPRAVNQGDLCVFAEGEVSVYPCVQP